MSRRSQPAGRARRASPRLAVLAAVALALAGCAGWPRVHVSGAGDDIEEWRVGIPL